MKEKELPEGWEWVRLSEVALKFINGGTPSTAINEYWNGSFPWTTSKSITSYSLSAGEKFISQDAIENSSSNVIPKNNILIASRVGIGKSAVNLIDIAISQDLTGVILDKKKILPEFLVRYLHNPKLLLQLESDARGTTIKGLQRSDLERIEIPLPPLPVQRQIVAVLEQAEALKRQRQEADALTGALLQSVFYEMFGNPIGNEKGWEKVTLGDIAIVQDVDHRMPPAIDEGISLISPKDFIENDKIDFANSKKISEDEYLRMCRKIKPQPGDILYSRYGTICETRLVPENKKFQISYSLCIIRPTTETISLKFLFWLLKMPFVKQEISKKQRSSCIPDLGLGELKKIKIPLPPLALQQQFAHIVEEVERVRGKQAESGKEIEALCDGLMQRAFAGELAG